MYMWGQSPFFLPIEVKEMQGEGCRVRSALSRTYVNVRDFLFQLTYVQNCAFLQKNLLSVLFLMKNTENKCHLINLFSIWYWNSNIPVNILIKIMDRFSPKLISQQIVTDDSYNLLHNLVAIALSGSLLL